MLLDEIICLGNTANQRATAEIFLIPKSNKISFWNLSFFKRHMVVIPKDAQISLLQVSSSSLSI